MPLDRRSIDNMKVYYEGVKQGVTFAWGAFGHPGEEKRLTLALKTIEGMRNSAISLAESDGKGDKREP